MIRRPPRSTQSRSSAASDVYKRQALVAGARLPGWTGGDGFFLGDGQTFVVVKGDKSLKTRPAWQPLLIRGRWIGDGWGTFWLQAEQVMNAGEAGKPAGRT